MGLLKNREAIPEDILGAKPAPVPVALTYGLKPYLQRDSAYG